MKGVAVTTFCLMCLALRFGALLMLCLLAYRIFGPKPPVVYVYD